MSKDRICHILSSMMESSEQVGFDSDSSSVIVDNSANDHRCSEEYIFTVKTEPILSNGVGTIDERDLIPKLIGTVVWSLTDNEGKMHTFFKNNILNFYIHQSPYTKCNCND